MRDSAEEFAAANNDNLAWTDPALWRVGNTVGAKWRVEGPAAVISCVRVLAQMPRCASSASSASRMPPSLLSSITNRTSLGRSVQLFRALVELAVRTYRCLRVRRFSNVSLLRLQVAKLRFAPYRNELHPTIHITVTAMLSGCQKTARH